MKHSVSILCRASSFLSTANTTKNMVQSRRLRSDTSSLACPSMLPLCTDLFTTDCSDKRLFQTDRSQFSVSPNALLYRYLLKVLRSSVIDQNTSNFTFPTHCRLSCTVGEEYKSISQWVLAIFLYITDAVFCFAMILSFYLLIVSKKNRYRMTRNPRRPYLYLWGMALVTFTVRAAGRYIPKEGFWCNADGSLVLGNAEASSLCRMMATLLVSSTTFLSFSLLWAIGVWMHTLTKTERMQRVSEDVVFLGLTKEGLLEVGVVFIALCTFVYSAFYGPIPGSLSQSVLDEIEGDPSLQTCIASKGRYSPLSGASFGIILVIVALCFLRCSWRFWKIKNKREKSFGRMIRAAGHEDKGEAVLQRWLRRHLVFFSMNIITFVISSGNFVYVLLQTDNAASFQEAVTDYAACRSKLVCPDSCSLRVPLKTFMPADIFSTALGPVLNLMGISTFFLWMFFEEIEWKKVSKLRGRFTIWARCLAIAVQYHDVFYCWIPYVVSFFSRFVTECKSWRWKVFLWRSLTGYKGLEYEI